VLDLSFALGESSAGIGPAPSIQSRPEPHVSSIVHTLICESSEASPRATRAWPATAPTSPGRRRSWGVVYPSSARRPPRPLLQSLADQHPGPGRLKPGLLSVGDQSGVLFIATRSATCFVRPYLRTGAPPARTEPRFLPAFHRYRELEQLVSTLLMFTVPVSSARQLHRLVLVSCSHAPGQPTQQSVAFSIGLATAADASSPARSASRSPQACSSIRVVTSTHIPSLVTVRWIRLDCHRQVPLL